LRCKRWFIGCYIDTTNELFCSAFSKAEAARLERKNSVSFWELFLCAYFVKEKVDERKAISLVSGTIYRY
jgi:hypothetical protein